MNETLQDRLVKELRLRGISDMAAANRYAPEFMADYNRRFAREPMSPHDAHRAVQAGEDLGQIFTWQEERIRETRAKAGRSRNVSPARTPVLIPTDGAVVGGPASPSPDRLARAVSAAQSRDGCDSAVADFFASFLAEQKAKRKKHNDASSQRKRDRELLAAKAR